MFLVWEAGMTVSNEEKNIHILKTLEYLTKYEQKKWFLILIS